MRRLSVLAIILVCLFTSWPATPQAQRGGPTLSADLLVKRKPGERIRVIVQGSDTGMTSLRGRLRAALRRDLGEGLAVDLSPRSEERRVGKECRSRGASVDEKKRK